MGGAKPRIKGGLCSIGVYAAGHVMCHHPNVQRLA